MTRVTFNSVQLRPVPDFSSATGGEQLLAVGLLQDRMQTLLLDINKLMSSADMGSDSGLLH